MLIPITISVRQFVELLSALVSLKQQLGETKEQISNLCQKQDKEISHFRRRTRRSTRFLIFRSRTSSSGPHAALSYWESYSAACPIFSSCIPEALLNILVSSTTSHFFWTRTRTTLSSIQVSWTSSSRPTTSRTGRFKQLGMRYQFLLEARNQEAHPDLESEIPANREGFMKLLEDSAFTQDKLNRPYLEQAYSYFVILREDERCRKFLKSRLRCSRENVAYYSTTVSGGTVHLVTHNKL